MKPIVVIGYPGFGDIEIEKEILRTIDAEVIHIGATHAAWYSEEAKVDVRRCGAEEVVRVLRNEPPRAPANRVEARQS